MAQNLFSKFTVFNKENLGYVRAMIDENGEPWFLGNDVAACLGHANYSKAISDHTDENDRKTLKFRAYNESLLANLWGKSDRSDKTIINEAGLYSLILGTKKESAREFKNWVTHEVLPSIRKYGGYIFGQENASNEMQEWLFDQLVSLEDALNSETEKNGRLKSKIYKMDEGHQSTEKLLNMYMEEADTLKKKVEELNNLIFAMSNPVPKEKEAKPKEFYVDEQGLVHSKNYKKNNNN